MTVNRDIQRLVYPPKVWVFVKTQTGIVDLTEYVVGGEVKRVINAASEAKIRLRNPNHLFTTYKGKNAVLHPMDPITIYMQRFNGHHVQVFTGYLDTTPYLQLIPGVVQIEATCTLKRLKYNYFQLAQMYTLAFFNHFGWQIQAGTIAPKNQATSFSEQDNQFLKTETTKLEKEFKEGKIDSKKFEEETNRLKEHNVESNEKALEAQAKEGKNATPTAPFANPGGKIDVSSDDGSFKKLLWAVLYYMADWKDENIYIEEIPKGVPELIAKLWTLFNEGQRNEELEDLKAYWTQLVGIGSKGTGGGAGNPTNSILGGETGVLTDIPSIVATMTSIAAKAGLPPEFVIATSLAECSFKPKEVMTKQTNGVTGWFQMKSSEPYGFAGVKINYPKDAQDTGLATSAFCKAARVKANELTGGHGLPKESEWQHWAEATQAAGEGAYNPSWTRVLSEAKKYVQQYKPSKQEEEENSTTERGKTKGQGGETATSKGSGSSKTRLAAMENRAKEIDAKKYPYAWSGGHESAGEPTLGKPGGPAGSSGVLGFDCSGSVAAVLAAGGFLKKGISVPGSGSFASLGIPGWSSGEDKSGQGVNIYFNSEHAWMTIKGQYFSTGWGADGAHLGSTNPLEQPEKGQYTVMHLATKNLEETYTGPEPQPLTGAGSSEGLENLGNAIAKAEGTFGGATAASFLSQIQAPTGEEWTLAASVGGQRALMNSTPVINLVSQVCDSSLRKFMSLPNGDFYAFYPDYFGEFGQHEPYWNIHNIEIQEGTIELSDDPLCTHFFAIGDVAWPANQKIVEELYAGVMTVFEAFQPGVLLLHEESATSGNEPKQGRAQGQTKEAVDFLKRYGARPVKGDEFNMVYSAVFDQLIAYQQFLLSWSRQFQSMFKFTFMPELFPGGKVGFPETGVKMYVEDVTHTWDLETKGFETTATLSAPSVYKVKGNESAIGELPNRMVEALVEPQRGHVGDTNLPHPTLPPPKRGLTKNEERANKAFGPGVNPPTSPLAPAENTFEGEVFG